MSSIIEVKVGSHTYLYESVSYRENGQVKNRRHPIGKVDPKTGVRHYKADYIEAMRAKGTPVQVASTEMAYSQDDIRSSTVLEAGLIHLLTVAAEQIGLLAAIREALPRMWSEIFALACFLAVEGETAMHTSDWAERVDLPPIGSLDSRRISELLASVDAGECLCFYEQWCKAREEAEFLALDVTSASSYSELIEDVEWGHNRDGESLPQVNLCLLMGMASRLPVYQTTYPGSIRDVSALDSVMMAFSQVTHGGPVTTVTDKGFYSERNIKAMMDSPDRRFLAAVPFTSAFAKRQVDGERKDIDRAANTIVVGGDSLRAVTKRRVFAGGWLHTHIFYSANKAQGHREDMLAAVAMLKEEATASPERCAASEVHTRFLNIRRSTKSDRAWTVSIKEGAIEAALGYTGWLVIISNCVDNAKEAIMAYRAKDVVEKGFMRLKDDIGLGRLRIHSQERLQNKVFVGFIALILLSHIHSVMLDHGLYRKMTARQLMRTLAKQRVQVINGERIMLPATKAQKEIYAAFGVMPPL